uniref:Integrase, catalytic region, zinc finger, CCHC-type, peptidase aspartic, catalytic n=1 Tax=Tanacetum cinerariifolium TaxID=118510 RepID=A0A6L2JC87_TANCI|nr:hypothetical protein [Tanacetum cinerariifolium]
MPSARQIFQRFLLVGYYGVITLGGDVVALQSCGIRINSYTGKENGVNIRKSIEEGPFQIGTFRETLVEGEEGAFHLGLPKDIYTLINHYTDAKDIWDNVKMLPEGFELTKEDRLSQMDNLIKNLTNTLSLLTQSYKTYLPQTNNQLRTSSNTRNQATFQDGRVVVQNVQGRQNRGPRKNERGTGAAGNEGAQNRVGNVNPSQARHINCYNYNDILFEVCDHDDYQDAVCEHHEVHEMHDDIQPNCIVDSDAEYMEYLKRIFEGIQKALTKEIKEMKEIFKEMEAEVDQNAVNRKSDEIEWKNLLIANDNLIDD